MILWQDSEYHYPLACGFIPTLVSYIHEESRERPAMLVVPGGGYCVVSPTEGEIVAEEFYKKGYNAFVLTYTTNLLMQEPLKNQPLQDLSRAVRVIRKNAEKLGIHPKKLAVCGFSAGAHLTGSLCVHYMDAEDPDPQYADISNRPDAAILSYPVITSGEYAHRGSFEALLGKNALREELEYMSLEKHVTSQTPPCFLWQTVTDETVPVENSYLFAEACRKAGVLFAHHVFSKGKHGLSLANEQWLNEEYGEPYTLEQIRKLAERIKEGGLPGVPEKTADEILKEAGLKSENEKQTTAKRSFEEREALKPVLKDVGVWPVLAESWLAEVLGTAPDS